MLILNLQNFLGLGIGMLIGYRPGFLARPHGYLSTRTYADEHKEKTYTKRKDGLIECATSKTTNYIKVRVNANIKLSNQFTSVGICFHSF